MRTPAGDFRVRDMFALPFDGGCFDVATVFNGIWKGCDDALAEARRVVRPGGLVGFTFCGSDPGPGIGSVARCGVAEQGGEPQRAAGCVGDAPQPAVRGGVCLVLPRVRVHGSGGLEVVHE